MTAVRSCDVIKGHQNVFFLYYSFALKRATTSRMVSLCSVHQDASKDKCMCCWLWTYKVSIYIFRCVSIRGSRWYCYFCSSMVGSKVVIKNSFVLHCRYFYFLTHVTSFLTWPKNALVKIVDFVSSAYIKCRLPLVPSLLWFSDLRGRISVPPPVPSWPWAPSRVRELSLARPNDSLHTPAEGDW